MASLTRREWLLIMSGAPAALAFSATPLSLRLDGDYLRMSAPQLTFLSGRVLQRLRDGASVALAGQLSISTDQYATTSARVFARFILSYDIWEEKFAVTRLEQVRRSASHLSLEAAQTWVLDSINIGVERVPAGQPFWMRLDLRVEDPRDGLGIVGEPGINLTRLVEIFGNPPRPAQQRWMLEAGPVRLADMRTRGSRG